MTSLASVAATQNAAATGATPAAAAGSTTQAGNALSSLSGNFSTFLNLLMTQLRNQDPTSPVDTNQFTQELVEFSQVEQQINTNSSLGTLIQVTQSGQIMQGAALVGKTVEVASSNAPVQNGQATISFNAPVAGAATVQIANSAGAIVATQQIDVTQGQNRWTWDGTQSDGSSAPDGLYAFALSAPAATGGHAMLSVDAVGTATGVTNAGGTIELQMGSLATPLGQVVSVDN